MNENVEIEYLRFIKKMLSLGKLRIAEIYPSVRIIRPELYSIALKSSNLISKERFLEDMTLLNEDIKKCIKCTNPKSLSNDCKKELKDIYYHFLKRNRFKGDEDIELLSKKTFEKNIL